MKLRVRNRSKLERGRKTLTGHLERTEQGDDSWAPLRPVHLRAWGAARGAAGACDNVDVGLGSSCGEQQRPEEQEPLD